MASTPTRSEPSVSEAEKPDDLKDLKKVSWKGVLKRSIKEFRNDNLSDWAAALTYHGVLALAPAALVLVAAVGLLGKSATQTLLDNIAQIAPGSVRDVLENIITTAQDRGTAGAAAIFGLLAAWWSASGYIATFMRASNAIYEVGEGRPAWKTIPVRLLITLAMVVLITLSAAIVIFTGPVADQIGQALGVGHTFVTVWDIAKWPVLVVIVSAMLAILYFAAPNVKQPGVQWVSPGGVVAVIIWVLASAGFAFYVSNFASYNKAYGTLAGVIVFLVWLWITNLAILLGAEFNAEMQHARAIEAGQDPDQKPFAEPRDTSKLSSDKEEQATALDQTR
ncbi:MAG: rane protein [Pseudonocardiales bacterium]|nr:rane protein [Pseudonocardiales bacterium]